MPQDNISGGRSGDRLYEPAALDALVKRFVERFGDFNNPDYIELEPAYKRAAAEQMKVLLSEEWMREQLASKEYEGIKQAAIKATRGKYGDQKFNLLNQWDMRPLLDTPAETLGRGLYHLLYGEGPFTRRLQLWIGLLAKHKPNVWPAATYYLVLHNSAQHIYVKPAPFTKLLNNLHSNVEWQTLPTAELYEQLLDLSGAILTATVPLGARDMIDVQSFVYLLFPSNPEHGI